MRQQSELLASWRRRRTGDRGQGTTGSVPFTRPRRIAAAATGEARLRLLRCCWRWRACGCSAARQRLHCTDVPFVLAEQHEHIIGAQACRRYTEEERSVKWAGGASPYVWKCVFCVEQQRLVPVKFAWRFALTSGPENWAGVEYRS